MSVRLFETGIKVVDLLTPYKSGGKIELFGGAGVGKTVVIMELILNKVQMYSMKISSYFRCYISSAAHTAYTINVICFVIDLRLASVGCFQVLVT